MTSIGFLPVNQSVIRYAWNIYETSSAAYVIRQRSFWLFLFRSCTRSRRHKSALSTVVEQIKWSAKTTQRLLDWIHLPTHLRSSKPTVTKNFNQWVRSLCVFWQASNFGFALSNTCQIAYKGVGRTERTF